MVNPYIFLNIGAERNDGAPRLTQDQVTAALTDVLGLDFLFDVARFPGGSWEWVDEDVFVVTSPRNITATQLQALALRLSQDAIAFYHPACRACLQETKGLSWTHGYTGPRYGFEPKLFVMPDGRTLAEHKAPADPKPGFKPFFRLLNADYDMEVTRTTAGQVCISKLDCGEHMVMSVGVFEQIIAAYGATK